MTNQTVTTSETLTIIDRHTFNTYREAAQAAIQSLKQAYPELSPDSLTALCYVAALELQSTEGYAATATPDEFVDIACEQVVGLSEQYQDDALRLMAMPTGTMH